MAIASQNSEVEILKLLETVHRLMAKDSDGWVPWRLVAKEQYGASEYEPICIGLAQLPSGKRYLAGNERVVKLTEEGLNLVLGIQEENPTELEQIVKGVTSYAARLRPIRIMVEGVSRVAKIWNRHVQAIQVNLIEEILPSEALVEFHPRNGSLTRGKVVGQEADGGVLYISFDSEVFESDLPAKLVVDRAFLLSELANRLRELLIMPPLFSSIMRESDEKIGCIAERDSLDVADRLLNLRVPWSRFLWGPPGAGKTYGLGRLVAGLLRDDPAEKVLVVAPSNRAVDVFVEQLIGQLEKNDPVGLIAARKVVRFGYPRKASIMERSEVLGPPELDTLNKKAEAVSARISKAEREKESDAEIAVLRAELLSVQEAVKDAVRNHIGESRVVATTVTLATLSKSPITEQVWTSVIVDEATMVPPAVCAFLASLASKRFLLAGDPRQLGPVYESDSRKTIQTKVEDSSAIDFEWMGRDIFDLAGVSHGQGLLRTIADDDVRLARITSQRRCTPEIWSKVENLYPRVEMLANEEKIRCLRDFPPCPGESIVILDTSPGLASSKCESEYGSWKNPYTAELAMEVACTIMSETEEWLSIAVISPYRAQVKLLRKAIRQEQRATGRCKVRIFRVAHRRNPSGQDGET